LLIAESYIHNGEQQMRKYLRKAGLIVLVNTAGGVFLPLFTWISDPSMSAARLAQWAEESCIYAYCIGTLAFLVMNSLGPRIPQLRRPLHRAAVLVLAMVGIATLGSLPASLAITALGWARSGSYWAELRASLPIAIAITICIGVIVTAFTALVGRLETATIELRTRQLEEERARKLATEARLSSLESRVHPHFLFNTLNSIGALIREDPPRAERTVERLAALLRYSLDANRQSLVPLRQELRIVTDYLEIEKTRFGERLRYTIDVQPEIEELELPPMALQTLVENSIKHAVSNRGQGGEVRIAARIAQENLTIEVSDDGPGFSLQDIKPGHGLENLRERLAALFDAAGQLEVTRRNGCTVVALAVPQKKVLV
jgi:two-component system, LytTR family, sensor histidine kinase AlgZ